MAGFEIDSMNEIIVGAIMGSLITLLGQITAHVLSNRKPLILELLNLKVYYNHIEKPVAIRDYSEKSLVQNHLKYDFKFWTNPRQPSYSKIQFSILLSNDKTNNISLRKINYRILDKYKKEIFIKNQNEYGLVISDSVQLEKSDNHSYKLKNFNRLNISNVSGNQSAIIDVFFFLKLQDLYIPEERPKKIYIEVYGWYSNFFLNEKRISAIKEIKLR